MRQNRYPPVLPRCRYLMCTSTSSLNLAGRVPELIFWPPLASRDSPPFVAKFQRPRGRGREERQKSLRPGVGGLAVTLRVCVVSAQSLDASAS